ncbi:hypothetical protein NPX13_g4269 [Xylaria arbuscula]|uniref:Uncharacterized protein n=1 Tax=Xylaria arbuscula TaxID=114810 RepID=A0A9W8NH54_9PEZI|nr:hypothetical protein NPX13_g4269 [Xylaria arbuscula]
MSSSSQSSQSSQGSQGSQGSQASQASSSSAVDPDVATQQWIDFADWIPKDIGYNWFSFCRALVENHHDVTDILHPPAPPEVPDYIQAPPAQPQQALNNAAPGGRRGDVVNVKIPADKVPDKDPAKGSWDHVRYHPEWTEIKSSMTYVVLENYTEKFMRTPANRWRVNNYRDAIFNIRPALRFEDTIKNPTEYALRFGIAEGRQDGRSRMSPTWSHTRNPVDDLANQVESLDEYSKLIAIELSREIREARGEMPFSSQEILPEVMDAVLKRDGLLNNTQLKAEVAKAAEGGMSLDQMVEELEVKHPRLRELHRNFLDNALDDQDYQRIILDGMTTDELIQTNAHTMANDVVIDLDNPIDRLFQRERWMDSTWKGSQSEYPKLAYNLGGIREEWNVRTNDVLWNALQPALRLASKILENQPPQLEAIYNMLTRQPIDPRLDARQNRVPPTLTKYVLQENLDINKTYPALRALENHYLFEWKDEALTYLHRNLQIDLDSGYSLGVSNYDAEWEIGQDEPYTKFCLGASGMWEEGQDQYIKLTIAVESVWPLLVDQYSESEKMACSFEIANTLLHELARQPKGIRQYLMSLEHVLWARGDGEPYFEDSPSMELGFDMENSLFGAAGFSHTMAPRHYPALHFARQDTHPQLTDFNRTDTVCPYYHYVRAVPLDTLSRFFRKSFWTGEFAAYGWAALRVRSDTFIQKYQLQPPNVGILDGILRSRFQDGTTRFLAAVPYILYRSRQRVLAEYLTARILEINWQYHYQVWWMNMILNNWNSRLMYPLPWSVELLMQHFNNADLLSATTSAADRAVLSGAWQDMFGSGGQLMVQYMVVYSQVQEDVGYMQRIVFQYPMGQSHGYTYSRQPNDAIDIIQTRLTTLRERTGLIAQRANDFRDMAQTVPEQSEWEAWRDRFYAMSRAYDQMLTDLDEVGKPRTHPFDTAAKARFNRLPTDEWTLPTKRWEKMAIREYQRAPQAVRNTIDEFFEKLNDTRLKNLNGKVTRYSAGILQLPVDHEDHPLLPSGPQSSAAVPPAQSEPPPSPMSGVIFGQPGGTQPSLDNDAPRRISRPSTASTAFQSYATSLLASRGGSQTQPAATNIFAQQQPIRRVSPGSRQLGQGSGRAAFQMFPNPFVDRTIMTSEAVAFEGQRRLREQAAQMQNAAAGIYTTQPMWRERRHVDSDDEMVT